MPISVERLHRDVRSQLKKHTSGFVSPEDIDDAIFKSAIDATHFSIKSYKNNIDKFSNAQELLFSATLASGEIKTLPTDVFEVAAIFDNDFEGDLLDYSEFNDRAKSFILPPINQRPIATVFKDATGNKIRVLPASATNTIKYWKNPTPCKFAYTETSGIPVYSAGGSTDLDFPISEYTNILNRTLIYLTPSAKNLEAAAIESQVK